MKQLLDNPVYNALLSGDAHLGSGTDSAKFFDEQVSPFAGFEEDNKNGFDELYNLLPPKRKILYATRNTITEPAGWQLTHHIAGIQFVFTGKIIAGKVADCLFQLPWRLRLRSYSFYWIVKLTTIVKRLQL